MPTDTPDLVSEYETKTQSDTPDLVSEFEQQKTARPPADDQPPVPRQNLDPVARAQGQPRQQFSFGDVVGTRYTQPDRETQAAVARANSPQTAASKAAGMPLADVAGKPHDPQLDQPWEVDAKTGQRYQRPLVPEADAIPVLDAWKGAEPLATGLSRINDNQGRETKAPVFGIHTAAGHKQQADIGVRLTPEQQAEEETKRRQRSLGAAEVLQGSGELMTPVAAGTAAVSPFSVLLGYGAGYGASEGAGAIVHGKVSPEDEQLIRAGAFFLPSALGVISGLKSGSVETPQGKFSAASIFGGKVKAGVGSTPDVITGRVKFGDTQFEITVPRGKPGAPGESATPAPQLTEGEQAMVAHEQSTGAIAKPAPPVPLGQKFGNKLSGTQVAGLSKVIAEAPEEERNALIEEAHKNISQWIADNNGRVFIDGKVVLAKNQNQVEALSAKIINDAGAAHDKATVEAKKLEEKAAKEQEKQTTAKTAQPSTPAPAPKPAAAPAKVKAQPKTEAPESQPAASTATPENAAPVVQKVVDKPPHDFASTQVNIDPKSEMGQQHAEAVAAMPDEHIGPNGKEDTPHVTVRYGLKDDSPEAIAKIKEAASKIAPFEATVGKTGSFPATKEGDRPIIAHVEKSPELNALRSAVEGAGDFKEDTHGEYKPHVTLGYVKPEHVAEYEGGSHLEGRKVPVDHVVVSKKDRTSKVIKLGGKPVPDLVAQHEATPDLVAEHEASSGRRAVERGPDRRQDVAARKRVADMSAEERAKALLTSETVDLPNKRAFNEAEHSGKSPAVAMSDADGLKAFNDKYGYEAGNTLLKAKAESLKEAGIDAYHDKGDEFLHRGESPEDLKTKLEVARKSLRNKEFTVTDATGKSVTLKGVDFSYGTGTDLASAEAGLKSHKAKREGAGERARGELRGIAEVGHEAAAQGGTEEVASLPEGIPGKGSAGRVPVKSLTLAPKEFQYKLNTNEHGVTNLLSGQKWNDDLAGVVSIWHNPADGKTYVVNGHHRVQLAKQNGQKYLLARHLDVKTASEARASGALQNIAEGRGTAVDAAKFFRERGITPADLEKHGVSLGEATAENGLALSKLDPYLFDKVVSGELSQGRGIAIGKATDNPATQEAILKLIEKAEKRGRKLTDGMITELARFANRSKETTTEETGLFGTTRRSENNALDKAEVSDYIKQKLSQEKRVFGAVSSEGKAEVLGQVKGQNIKAGANQKIAQEAAQAGELYDRLSSSKGPIDDILENAAQRIAQRENPISVKVDAYKQARAELRKTLPGVEGPSTGRLQGRAGSGKEVEREADGQASVKQSDSRELRRRKPSADDQPLPGMAPHIEAEKESAAATQGEDLSKKLTETKSISAKTGEMERSSPLFRDSEASGQTGLFGDRSIKGKESERGFVAADIPEVLTRGVVEPVASFVKDTIKQTAESRSVDDKLFGLSKQYEADVLRAVELMKQVGPLSTPEDQAAIYHHLEDSSVPLDPKQQAVLDKIVKPLMSQSSAIRSELNSAGVPMGEEGYVHRVVKGKSSQLERAMRKQQGTGKGNVLSKAASSTKGRVMMGLTAEGSGRRVVVSIKGDRVTKFENGTPTDLGPLRSGMTTKFELQHEKLSPLADRIIELKQQIKDLPEKDRAEQLSNINEKIADLEAQRETLNSVKGRVKGQRAAYGVEPTFNQRKTITNELEKLAKERDRIQNTKDDSFMSNAGKEAMRRAQEHLTVAQNQRARILEQVDPAKLEDKIWIDSNGKKWTINQGTTKEIEKHTDLTYYHNALASAVTDYLQLLRAKRANDALESMKADPGFNEMAFKSEKGSMPPDGWRSVDLPQFRDYYFEPHMAEVLNRFAKELHPEPATFLEKVGNFMTASLLLNPIRHIYNIGNHWLVERGVSGVFNPLTWPTAAKAGMKAIKAVVNQNEDFLSALDHGAPMMSHRVDLQQLHHELFQTIVGHLENNPGIADQIARFTGYDKLNPEDTGLVNAVARGTGLRMLNNIRKLGQKAMWMSNDMMMLQSAYEKMANGSDFNEAMAQTERHIPNYRIPTRIMNSKAMGDFMGSRLASMFGRYHYGVWKSYGEMIKEAASPTSTPKERLRGLDHLIMLGLITFIMYPLWKKVLEKLTGDKDARMVVSGASAVPNSIANIAQGKEDPSQLLRNTFTPAILPQAAAEAMFNRDFFSGAPIRNPKHSAAGQAIDVSKHFVNSLGPVQQYNQAHRASHPVKQFLLSQVGVSTSHPKKHR